ncbi:transposase [Streptococcus pneumoniae]|nr:transposase [Streptococcus pneumoniae]
MMVAETPLVKKNHQIPRIINQKIAQKLIEKISMTDIAHQLSISTSTVIRKLNDFHFECNFRNLPKIMSWDVETVSQTVSLPNAKIVLDRFHIVQHLSRAMSRVRVQIMNQFERKSHEYKAIKHYWKLIQQDSRKLSDK